jgi:shikimate kinase
MRPSDHNIFLIGPMGSGKTTIGRIVARELGLEFHDCDQALEKLTGASVNLIFDVEGETGFRGGVVTRKENRKLLQSSGLVVWLRTTVKQQLKRLSLDKSRPLLQTTDRVARLERLARERDPLYRDLADLVFSSPDRNPKVAARTLSSRILEHLQSTYPGNSHAYR